MAAVLVFSLNSCVQPGNTKSGSQTEAEAVNPIQKLSANSQTAPISNSSAANGNAAIWFNQCRSFKKPDSRNK